MTILIVSPKFSPIIGGGETYALSVARQLTLAGNKVVVACAPHKDRDITLYPFTIVEIEGLNDLEHMASAIPKLYNLIKTEEPDVIHANGYFALLASGLAHPEKKCKITLSIHSTPVWGERIFGKFKDFDAELAFVRNILAFTKPNALIVGSETYADAAEKMTAGSVPVVALSYSVDTEFMKQTDDRLRDELAIDKDKVIITIPSRILARKGILEAVQSLEYLPNNYVLFLPAAHDPHDPVYWHSITSSALWKKVKERVVLPKRRISYDDLPYMHSMSDIIAMPSYYEGFGLAALEAMSVGTPVIGADVQGLQQLITDGTNGRLIPAKDPEALAGAVREIMESKTLCSTLIEGGKHTADTLSLRNHVKGLLRIYKT